MENIEGKGKIWYTVVLQQEFANIKWQFEEQGHGKSHIPYLENCGPWKILIWF